MKYKYSFLTKSLLLFFPVLSAQTNHSTPFGKPNVIFIMADDLGWGDVGFNGNKEIKTPNLDALAQEGILLNQFYSAAPVSSPTRASVLTGRNSFRTGVFSANVGILRPEEITLPELLKDAGYRTGHFGKWHLGTLTYKEKDANRGKSGNDTLYNPPAWHGYNEAFVTESKVPTYDPMIKPLKSDGRFWNFVSETDSILPFGTSYWNIKGKKVIEGLDGDDSKIIIDRVIPFIDESINNNKPFLSMVWFHAPHLPCVAGPQYASFYSKYDIEKRNYYGCITAMDDQIGRLVNYLKDKNIYENTVIFFCSDNGPEQNTPGSTGEFKGRKRSLHEGGLRVPSFMVWKNEVKENSILNNACSTSDYLPTLLDILNIDFPDNRILDGESIWPLISNRTKERSLPLIFCSDKQGAIIMKGYKLYYNAGEIELYKINQDPFEKMDLSKKKPKIVKLLYKELKLKFDSYKTSFEGMEYGVKSYSKVHQKWSNVIKEEKSE